jgi:uncharacterized membrane protein YeaQ/YmgE (transglycosylase-associated protein family)
VCSGFRKRSCSNKKLERDDDSTKSHPALARVMRGPGHPAGTVGGDLARAITSAVRLLYDGLVFARSGGRSPMEDHQIGWIAAIIIGGIAGWLAEQFMKSEMGLLMNIVLGIVGAAVASWLLGFLGVSLTGWIGYSSGPASSLRSDARCPALFRGRETASRSARRETSHQARRNGTPIAGLPYPRPPLNRAQAGKARLRRPGVIQDRRCELDLPLTGEDRYRDQRRCWARRAIRQAAFVRRR